ncbi:glycosyltransferase [Bryobacter aggregatus]|uniref:glycosyltransferase n=1 Tax=Bryobacter aggregatus TaxID=360054 RepID=UPI0004E0C8CB|nr:glycosyltransferase family 2 protein [Bryobacter aggregatus]
MRCEYLTIVVPAYNAAAVLPRCLGAIQRSTLLPGELIVVSDSSTDNTVSIAEQFGATVLQTSVQSGPAVARNIGAKAAQGDLILFLDSDVEACPDAIEKIVKSFEEDPQLDALIGSYDFAPDGRGFISRYRNLLHSYFHQQGKRETIAFWGACGAVRKDAFLAVGGFDVSFGRPSIEDIELGYRMKKNGSRIALDPSIHVKHLKVWTLSNMVKTDLFDRAIPWTRLILREGEMPNDLNVQWSQRLSVALAMVALPALFLGWGLAVLCWLCVIAINWPVYSFLARQWHWGGAIGAMPVHFLYYFYSGLGFAIGFSQHVLAGPIPELAAGEELK